MKKITINIDGIRTITGEDDIPTSSELKTRGLPYDMNGTTYQIPLDESAQNGLTTINVQSIVGSFIGTNFNFSNGVIMPIGVDDIVAFTAWFSTERGKFF